MSIADLVIKATTWVFPVILAITFHEAAHGYVARFLGDDTAEKAGRLSLNPFRHIHPVGTIAVPAVLLFVGAPYFGWAKPVPITPSKLLKPYRDIALVAAAGPASNILMAILAALAFHLLDYVPDFFSKWLEMNLENFLIINVLLAIFNSIPIPPLDGSRILFSLLPKSLAHRFLKLERYGVVLLIAIFSVIPMIASQFGYHISLISLTLAGPMRWMIALITSLTGIA